MQVWNVLHAARWKCRTQKIAKKSPSAHHRTNLSGCIFATKAHIDNLNKNLLSSNASSTCSDNMMNFCLLEAELEPVVLGTPANFNGFRVLAALLHSSQVLGVSQTLRRWTEGGAPPMHVFCRASITFLVSFILFFFPPISYRSLSSSSSLLFSLVYFRSLPLLILHPFLPFHSLPSDALPLASVPSPPLPPSAPPLSFFADLRFFLCSFLFFRLLFPNISWNLWLHCQSCNDLIVLTVSAFQI